MWCVWNLNSTSNSTVAPCQLSCQISDNQRKAETNTNLNKHWKICAKSNNVITNVIFTNQHFALTILMQIFKFQRWVGSSPSFCRPVARAPWRACSQASFFSNVNISIKFFHKEVNWKWNDISALQCNVREAKKGYAWNLLFQEVALTVLINPFLFIVESFIIVNINIQNLYMYVCNMPIAWHKLCSEGCFRDGSEKLIQCFRLHYTFLLTCQMYLTNKVWV